MTGGVARSPRWAGDRSLLVDFDSLDDAMSARSALTSAPLQGQVDVIAGARTVMVRLRSHWHALQALPALSRAAFPAAVAPDAQEVVFDVAYDGADLDELAETLGMSAEALVTWHTGQTWLGAFGGVAGFVYCVARDSHLSVPRHSTPRAAVPGGSVIVAAEFSGVYPRTGPSGWQIIGRTDAHVWDVDRDPPALLKPWDTIRYRPVRPASVIGARTAPMIDEAIRADHARGDHARADRTATAPETTAASAAVTTASAAEGSRAVSPATLGTPVLEVVDPGLQTLVQDLGREGAASVGAGMSGAVDRPAAVTANHLVGNEPGAPILESLFGGLRVRALATSVVAVTGADVPVTVSSADSTDRSETTGRPFVLLTRDVLTVGRPPRGARTVLALRGGVAAAPALGSASTDTHIGVGPAPLDSGDVVRVGRSSWSVAPSPHSTGRSSAADARTQDEGEVVLRVVLGPRDDWFSPAEQHRFVEQPWRVTPASDRVGLRLEPGGNDERVLVRTRDDELLSEGMALGSVQVPPSGCPVLLLNDQAITGGYPIIAVVIGADLPRAGQLTPHSTVRFQPVDPASLRPLCHAGGTQT